VLIEESADHPERFAVLFDRHAVAVHRYLARRVGGLADDLLGETFLAAFQGRARFTAATVDARPWLFGIATNLLRRHARDERQRYRLLARVPRDAPTAPSEGIEARLDAHAMRANLAGALARLSDGDRDALLLLAYGDLTYAEIAAVLGVPVGTVRSRINRARRITREALDIPGEDS
jgi:RNA polymerase sigma-70 factor (ECF subfamily)